MALLLGKTYGCAANFAHNQTICHLSGQKSLRQYRCYVRNLIVNGASTIRGLASQTTNWQRHHIIP